MRRPVGVKWIDSCFREQVIYPAELTTVAMLPFALSRSESFRSVQVGRSRFSRCCHLISDLSFLGKRETRAWRLTQSPELGFGFCIFSSWNDFDFFLGYAAAATETRLLLCKGS
jgi:hypothetical protein